MGERQLGEKYMETWLEYTKNQESPEKFHKWTAISAVMNMLGRKVWVDMGYFTVYPNDYVLLVGASGRVKKDTAIDISLDLVKECPNSPPYFEGQTTYSALLGHLSQLGSEVIDEEGNRRNSTIYLIAPELANFLGGQKQGNQMLTLLTDIYKSPDRHPYVTRAHGWEELRNVCVNLLGASTIRWLRDTIPETALGGGFTARVLFVLGKEPKARSTDPRPPARLAGAREKFTYDLSQIGYMSGPFQVENMAREFLDRWYKKLDYTDVDVIGPYLERKLVHIYKVAMALSAMRDSELVITLKDAKKAHAYLTRLEPGMREIYGRIQRTDWMQGVHEVKDIILTRGRIGRTELLQQVVNWCDAAMLDKIMDTIIGVYAREKKGDGGGTVYEAYGVEEIMRNKEPGDVN